MTTKKKPAAKPAAKNRKADKSPAHQWWPRQTLDDKFYLIPESTFNKLRILVLADVAYEVAGEPMWDALANDMHKKFDDHDLTVVRFTLHNVMTRAKVREIGCDSVASFL
jgi:hypothetical protein